ncbi:MAG: ABC transporter substrate-binding protein [Clostridia bacterium]|nr:ABC transporter substrate-binding protein [Clostridia bacterium]
MKKILLLVLSIALVFLVGCNKDSKEETVTLNVFNWGDYIGEETIAKFEEETGIKVNYEMFDSNEAMYTKLKSGAVDYDVLIPSDYMIEKLISEDMLLELDMNNIDNFKYVDDTFKGLAYDPDNKYSVAYMWGTLGILYNTEMVTEPVDSWNILWDEKYADSIIMKDSVRDSFVPALKLMGESINTMDEGKWEEALKMLQAQKAIVQGYAADEVRDKMIGEEAALSIMYSGEALLTMEENENLAYVVPKEGSNMWFDAMCIPKTAKNKAAAEQFINFMTRPDIAFENADYIGYSTPITEAKKMLDPEIQNDPAAYPSADILEQCEVFIDLGQKMTDFTLEKWNELKAY